MLSLPRQSWQHFFVSCLAMLHYYQGPSTSNIWEQRLKHQQFSRWVSSLAWRDERSRCSPHADSPVIGLCRHRAAVSQAARPVMRMRWQESRQVPSKPPGAGQQWFSVWTSSLAQCVLYCGWTVQPSQGMSVWSWCRFSLCLYFPLVSPLGHPPVSLICFTLFQFFCVFFLLLSLYSCVFFSLSHCLRSPLSSQQSASKEIPILLTQTEKRTDTVKTPRSPAKRATRFSREKLTKNFFPFSAIFFFHSLLTLSLSIFRFLSFSFSLSPSPLPHQESSIRIHFLSLLVLTCSSSVRKCPLRSYLYSDVGHRNTFINLLSAIMHTKGCWYRDS